MRSCLGQNRPGSCLSELCSDFPKNARYLFGLGTNLAWLVFNFLLHTSYWNTSQFRYRLLSFFFLCNLKTFRLFALPDEMILFPFSSSTPCPPPLFTQNGNMFVYYSFLSDRRENLNRWVIPWWDKRSVYEIRSSRWVSKESPPLKTASSGTNGLDFSVVVIQGE